LGVRGGLHHDNLVLTTVVHPSLDGVVHHEDLGHYALSRALSEVAGGMPLEKAADAPSFLAAFGLAADCRLLPHHQLDLEPL
jgi:hypothetical protein